MLAQSNELPRLVHYLHLLIESSILNLVADYSQEQPFCLGRILLDFDRQAKRRINELLQVFQVVIKVRRCAVELDHVSYWVFIQGCLSTYIIT
jgi:hypothetical protein